MDIRFFPGKRRNISPPPPFSPRNLANSVRLTRAEVFVFPRASSSLWAVPNRQPPHRKRVFFFLIGTPVKRPLVRPPREGEIYPFPGLLVSPAPLMGTHGCKDQPAHERFATIRPFCNTFPVDRPQPITAGYIGKIPMGPKNTGGIPGSPRSVKFDGRNTRKWVFFFPRARKAHNTKAPKNRRPTRFFFFQKNRAP